MVIQRMANKKRTWPKGREQDPVAKGGDQHFPSFKGYWKGTEEAIRHDTYFNHTKIKASNTLDMDTFS